MTKKFSVIFLSLTGYDSHLIFDELSKFDVKIDVTPNRLEKYMASFLSKNLVFIDSMQFMNSSIEKLVKNLLDGDLKHLTEEFGSNYLELLKQKDAYPYEYMDKHQIFQVLWVRRLYKSIATTEFFKNKVFQQSSFRH